MPPSTEHPHGGGGDGPDGPTQAEIDRRFAELINDPDLKELERPSSRPGVAPVEYLPDLPLPRTGSPSPTPPRTDDDVDGGSGAAPESGAEASPTLGGPRDYAPPDELDEGFQPPEPEPLGTADPIRLLAWTGAIAGPILLLLVVLVWPSAPALVWLTLLAVTVGGWGVAFARLPRSREDDDDGAVV